MPDRSLYAQPSHGRTRRHERLTEHRSQARVVGQLDREPDAVAQAPPIALLLEKAQIDRGLDLRTVRLEAELAAAERELEAGEQRDERAARLYRRARGQCGAGVEEDLQIVPRRRAGSRVAERDLEHRQVRSVEEPRRGPADEMDDGVIHEVLPDAGQVYEDRDPVRPQLFGRADAGEEEEMWATDRSGSEDERVGLDRVEAAIDRDIDGANA